jgi:NitT/TauT family transport system permease protein
VATADPPAAQSRNHRVGLTTFAAVIIAWYLTVTLLAVPDYLVPAPQAVFSRMIAAHATLNYHALITLLETLGGFCLATVLGVMAAMLFIWSQTLERVVMPVLLVVQTFPKIALAPLIVIWFGVGLGPKLLISFLVAVFPVLVGAMVGMRSVDSDMIDLARSMQATPLRIFWRVRLPFALPQIFGALKVAIAFAIVGAVVGEWVGADKGLGYLLIWANANLDTTLLFAILVYLAVIGLVLYYAVELVEKLALPWHVSMRSRDLSPTS